MLARIYLALLWRALVDAMYYFLGTCAAGGLPQQALASLARRSPAPASRARSTKELHHKNHRMHSPPVTTVRSSPTALPSARAQMPLKAPTSHFRPLWTHTHRLHRRRGAVGLGEHRLFMVFVAKRPEASSPRRSTPPSTCVIAVDLLTWRAV